MYKLKPLFLSPHEDMKQYNGLPFTLLDSLIDSNDDQVFKIQLSNTDMPMIVYYEEIFEEDL